MKRNEIQTGKACKQTQHIFQYNSIGRGGRLEQSLLRLDCRDIDWDQISQ